MKRGFNLAATTFVSASLVFGCALTLSQQAGAKQTPVNSSDQSKSSQLIAQSCRDIEIRPNGNQDISFYKGTATARWVTTCNNYRFELQGDGNLVLYNPSNKPLWATGTVGRGYKLKVQGDGNVVLYDSNGQALWATMTNGNPGAFFSIQPDGNLVVYRLSDRRPLWYTATDGGRSRTLSASSEWLASRQTQQSPIVQQTQQSPIVQRAKVWVDKNVAYSQGATANPDGSTAKDKGSGYRTDCSGFVSMAWGLPATGLNVPWTGTLGNYANTFSDPNQLQPGDAINYQPLDNGHVVLFVQWKDKSKGTFVAYEENYTSGKTVKKDLTLVSNNQGWTIKEYESGRSRWVFQRKK